MGTSAASHLPPAYPERAPRGTAQALRAWQQRALDAYLARIPRDFLAVATPGAGKTTFALRVAAELLARRAVERITVVAPTEHLKTQWADAAARVGIRLDPGFSAAAGATSRDYTGVAVTYAGVAANPLRHRRRTETYRTLVVLDEVHHAGDALAWGDGTREAFEPARHRLALTGTPFRSDVNPIPFVSYVPGPDGVPRSAADSSYGYADALADGVVRPVIFLAYGGQMRWRTRAGDEVAAALAGDQARDVTAQAWRTALDPGGEWVPAVLRAADARLSEVRRHVPDAGGLVIATDQSAARAYARTLARISGEQPVVVVSDDVGAGSRITAFAEGAARWMVAVRMVSEGVDVPRLMVGVYATSTATPLFFAQAVGRFVRVRRRGETASLFLPSVPVLLTHAGALEVERDHVLGRAAAADDVWGEEEGLLAAARAEDPSTPEPEQLPFEALESSAEFDRVLFDGSEFAGGALDTDLLPGHDDADADFLGIPGLLDPDQVGALLRSRAAGRPAAPSAAAASRRPSPAAGAAAPGGGSAGGGSAGGGAGGSGGAAGTGPSGAAGPGPSAAAHVRLPALRRELNDCVRAFARQKGLAPAAVHADLRRTCGGPPTAQAGADEIAARIAAVRAWAVGRTA